MSQSDLGRSTTFFALTPEKVLEAVEVRGQRSTGYALQLNSFENRVYEVELEDETKVIAKFYRPGRWSREAILEEHAFLRQLEEAEIPVVPPLALAEGTLGELRGESDELILYCVFPRVRGRVPEELDREQLSRLGRFIARLHNVGASGKANHRPALTPETYGTRSLEILAAGEFVPKDFAEKFFDTAKRLIQLCASKWFEPEMIRLHGDCHLNNLLWGNAGPFFLDFDDFLTGPPVQDLWLLVPGNDQEAREKRDVMMDAYETMRALDRSTARLIEPLRSLRILRYNAWIAQRWQDPAFQRAFPQFPEHRYWQREIEVLFEQYARCAGEID